MPNADSKPLICIAGKNQIAVDVFNAAVASGLGDVVVIPDSKDVGQDDWQPSLRRVAVQAGAAIADLDSVMAKPELCFLSLEYERIVRPERFRSKRLYNLHFSLLPKFRGCNTSVWPILLGERQHGVTLHHIDAGVDTGAIIDQRSFDIAERTARQLYFECMRAGADLMVEWLPALVGGTVPAVSQPDEGASTFRRSDLDFALKEIDLNESVEQVFRRVRAFTFPEYQLPTLQGRPIFGARPVDDHSEMEVGAVVERGDGTILARAADGTVEFDVGLPAGGRD